MKLNRRSFFGAVGALFGIGAVAASEPVVCVFPTQMPKTTAIAAIPAIAIPRDAINEGLVNHYYARKVATAALCREVIGSGIRPHI